MNKRILRGISMQIWGRSRTRMETLTGRILDQMPGEIDLRGGKLKGEYQYARQVAPISFNFQILDRKYRFVHHRPLTRKN